MLTKEQIENIRLSHQGPSCKDAQTRTLLDEYETLRDSLAKLEGLYECQERLHDSLRAQLAAKEQATKLMLALARHIWNPDNMSLHRWGVVGMDLLADVQKAFPAEYESQVKGTPNPAEHGDGK